MKSMAQMQAEVEAQRKAAQSLEIIDDLDSSLGGNVGYQFHRVYTGEVNDDDDLVISVQDGLLGEDSPWPLTDVYRWFQGIISEAPPGGLPRGTLTVHLTYVPEGQNSDEE